jgi:hypothetical protein
MNRLCSLLLALSAFAGGQTTPNYSFNGPPHSAPNWDYPRNSNFFSSNQTIGIKTLTGCANTASGMFNALCYSGADIGVKVNAALAAPECLATGCHIKIPAGYYPYTTPIVLAGKNIWLDCDTGGGGITASPTMITQLYYTGTGTAVTFDPGGTNNLLSGCGITGNNTASTVGLQVGGSSGAVGAVFSNNDISGFTTCLQFSNIVYITTFRDNFIHDCSSHEIYAPAGLGTFGENVTFNGGDIYNKGAFSATGIQLSSACDYHFNSVSIDNVGITLDSSANIIDFTLPHNEISGGATNLPILTLSSTCTNCRVTSHGGLWLEDFGSVGRTSFINVVGANSSVNIFGGRFTATESVPQIVNFTSNGICTMLGTINESGFASDCGGSLLQSLSCSNDAFPSNCMSNRPYASNAQILDLSTAPIAAHSCSGAQSAALGGVVPASVVLWDFATSPVGVTGYGDNTTPFLTISAWSGTNTVSVNVCNPSAVSITPGPISVNLRAMN